jgi:hypothetical protein
MNAARQTSYFEAEEKHFLRALLYFDIFNYPLTAEEVSRYSPAIDNFSADQFLENLVSRKILFRFENFYSLHDDPQMVLRRVKGNVLAEKKMKTAKRFSYLISLFPFVRAVMLSGSISKGYMDENSDIDYFIVTEVNRLWVVRVMLAIFRRIFLFNSHKNFCTNYFIDNHNLEIGEKNIFTAVELRTTKPMFGLSTIEKFHAANAWAFSFLPNFILENEAAADRQFFFKTIIEKIFSFREVDHFNQWLMMKSMAYWKRRYGPSVHPTDFEIAFRSTTGISKSHPQFFQKKVLIHYDKKINDFEIKNGIDLTL